MVWGSYCPVLSPPYFYLFPLRLLGGLGGSGSSDSGGQGGQGQDQNLTGVSVVQPSGGTVMHRTAFRGPTGPYVPQPMGGNTLVNPHYDPNCYDSDDTMYAVLAAARTSTPLHAACSRDTTSGSTQSLVSDAGSFKSVVNPDAQGCIPAVGGAEATLVADPLLLYHPEHGVVVDRASLEDNLMESILSGLVESILGAFTQPLAAEVLDTMDTSTQTQSLDLSTRPLVAEAAPTRRSRPSLPRMAKTKGRGGLYRDPDDPYRRFSK